MFIYNCCGCSNFIVYGIYRNTKNESTKSIWDYMWNEKSYTNTSLSAQQLIVWLCRCNYFLDVRARFARKHQESKSDMIARSRATMACATCMCSWLVLVCTIVRTTSDYEDWDLHFAALLNSSSFSIFELKVYTTRYTIAQTEYVSA